MGVRLASINQILDPWLYILMRKALIYKIFRYIKHWLCLGRLSRSKPVDKSLHSYENVDVEAEIPMGAIHNYEIKIACSGGRTKDDGNGSDGNESVSSTSNLLNQCSMSPMTQVQDRKPSNKNKYFMRSVSTDDSRTTNNNLPVGQLSRSHNDAQTAKRKLSLVTDRNESKGNKSVIRRNLSLPVFRKHPHPKTENKLEL